MITRTWDKITSLTWCLQTDHNKACPKYLLDCDAHCCNMTKTVIMCSAIISPSIPGLCDEHQSSFVPLWVPTVMRYHSSDTFWLVRDHISLDSHWIIANIGSIHANTFCDWPTWSVHWCTPNCQLSRITTRLFHRCRLLFHKHLHPCCKSRQS